MTAMSIISTCDAYLRLPDVIAVTGMSKATIYRRINTSEFPRPYELGANSVAWKRSDVESWIESRQRRRAPS